MKQWKNTLLFLLPTTCNRNSVFSPKIVQTEKYITSNWHVEVEQIVLGPKMFLFEILQSLHKGWYLYRRCFRFFSWNIWFHPYEKTMKFWFLIISSSTTKHLVKDIFGCSRAHFRIVMTLQLIRYPKIFRNKINYSLIQQLPQPFSQYIIKIFKKALLGNWDFWPALIQFFTFQSQRDHYLN